jgi:hypothetical protein
VAPTGDRLIAASNVKRTGRAHPVELRPDFQSGSSRLACGVVRTFVQSQRLTGNNLLAIVGSVDEAFTLFVLNAPHFEDIG